MIEEIKKSEFQRVKNLFQGVFFNLNSLAVINGDSEGRVWVDNKEQPQSGLLVDNGWSSYLAGDPDNRDFNKHISKIIQEIIFPEAEKLGAETNPEFNNNEWVIYYDDDKWNKKIEEDFGFKDYIELKRCHYKLEKLKIPNWRKLIDVGFSMEKVDSNFLKRDSLENFKEVTNWIKESWKSTEDFLARGFGFCLVKDDLEIVSYGMADWATEDKIEMGIGTISSYRRKGFATLVVSAAIEYCIENKLELGWHCSEHNDASWKTAEKAGLKKIQNYTAAVGCFDEFQNLIENSWYKALYLNQPKEGLNYIEKAVKHERAQVSHWLLYAVILARNKELGKSIQIFNKSIDLGVENPARLLDNLNNRDDLKVLKKEKEWEQLIRRLEQIIRVESNH